MTKTAAQPTIALEQITLEKNIRELNPEHVDALCGSIKERGLIVPLVVKPDGNGGYQLVAGYHRHAACTKAGIDEVPVVVRDESDEAVDRAVENITRRSLTPLEEARAVEAMLAQGHNTKSAAAALGWSQARVSARASILTLPESAQALSDGRLAPAAIKVLVEIGEISPPLCEHVAKVLIGDLDASHTRRAEHLAKTPGRVLTEILQTDGPAERGKWYAAQLRDISQWQFPSLNLGKTAQRELEELVALSSGGYGGASIRIAAPELDRARAAGVLLEYEHAALITDRAMHKDILRTAITRSLHETKAAIEERKELIRQERAEQAELPETPERELERQHRAAVREFAARAANVNLDLGHALTSNLIEIDPDDVQLARFMVYSLLGPDGSPNRARQMAVAGLRLVLEELRQTEQRQRKDGTPRPAKITYLSGEECEAALWQLLGRARTARELYGRLVVIVAAGHYAMQDALPRSGRVSGPDLRSKDDTAVKALERLCNKHLPSTYKNLRKEIARESAEYYEAMKAAGR